MAFLSDLLQGIPLNSVLRERIALAEQKYKDLEDELKNLKDKAAALSVENESLRKQVADQRTMSKLIERRGVLWKREDDGNYLPCCPKCKSALSLIPPHSPDFLACNPCKFDAPFHPDEIPKIVASLPR